MKAMLIHPQVGLDPFVLSELSGVAADVVQRVILSLPTWEEIEAYQQEKVMEAIRANTPDPYWLQRYELEELLNAGNED